MRVANDLIRLDPNDPMHHFKKALLCQHQTEVKLAVDEFERVVEMAPETELAESAREHLDVLDSYQLESIMALAMEDVVFRAKLIRDPNETAQERGYFLSYVGRDALQEMATQELPDFETGLRPQMYH